MKHYEVLRECYSMSHFVNNHFIIFVYYRAPKQATFLFYFQKCDTSSTAEIFSDLRFVLKRNLEMLPHYPFVHWTCIALFRIICFKIVLCSSLLIDILVEASRWRPSRSTDKSHFDIVITNSLSRIITANVMWYYDYDLKSVL